MRRRAGRRACPDRLGPPDSQRRPTPAMAITCLKAMGQRVAAEPDNIPVRLELAKLYRERGYPEVALEICRLAAERFPESVEAQLALVRALYEMKRPQEAIAALEAHPRQIGRLLLLAGDSARPDRRLGGRRAGAS